MTSREQTRLFTLPDSGAWPEDLPRKVADKATVIGWALIQWPWLAKSLSGGTKAAKAALLARLGLPADALPNLGSWKADTGLLHLLVDHIEAARPTHVVELGSGASSLIVAKALSLYGGGRLTSFDQHPDFVAATHGWLKDHGVDADMYAAPFARAQLDWPGAWYDLKHLPDTIDLLLIDGPPWTIHPFVRGSAEVLFERISVGGTVMLDDAARPGERVIAKRWRDRWPNFEFELRHAGTKGTLIGKKLS